MKAFTEILCDQRSKEWFEARAGRLTGSVAADMLATLKSGGEAASRRDLRVRLALERLTGQPLEDDYLNADMKRGIELEPEALLAFEAETGQIARFTGFLAHAELPIGCSLDGHFGDFEGILEMKVPRSANHWKYLRGGSVVPAEHKAQIVHNLFVTGAQYAEFCSYDPRFPQPLRLFRVRYERNEQDLASYELALRQFLKEVDTEYESIRTLAGCGVAA